MQYARGVDPGDEREQCPSCGGAGGGPFGRPNSAWDDESYQCPRCEGTGWVRRVTGPGIAKTTLPAQPAAAPKRKAKG